MRLKNFVSDANISNNNIKDCGIHGYRFGMSKNGEGVYIGTSTRQVGMLLLIMWELRTHPQYRR